jgi:DNA-binding HxlR family transcriptional regulator
VATASPKRRSYRQYCGVARALDLVGERWTLLIVRDLLLGPRRYSDLLRALPGVTTNLLAKRLQDMTAAGIVSRTELPPPASVPVYALTPAGEALQPVVMELGRWGGRFLGAPRRGDRLDVGWALLSAKRRYKGGLSGVLDVCTDEGRKFELVFDPRQLHVHERPASRADAIVRGPSEAIRVAFASPNADEAERAAARLTIEGHAEMWRNVLAALERQAPERARP